METQEAIKRRYELLAPGLDERQRRLLAASEAMVLGRGGGVAVSRATGVSRRVIRAGMRELQAPESLPAGRVRRPGGGRKSAVEKDPGLPAALERLIEPTTRGIPNRRSGGPARACGSWPRRCGSRGMPSASGWWPTCCARW